MAQAGASLHKPADSTWKGGNCHEHGRRQTSTNPRPVSTRQPRRSTHRIRTTLPATPGRGGGDGGRFARGLEPAVGPVVVQCPGQRDYRTVDLSGARVDSSCSSLASSCRMSWNATHTRTAALIRRKARVTIGHLLYWCRDLSAPSWTRLSSIRNAPSKRRLPSTGQGGHRFRSRDSPPAVSPRARPCSSIPCRLRDAAVLSWG